MRLFHSSPILLAPGSIVEPGNWGRIEKTEILSNFLIVNYLLELERKSNHQNKPSRMKSCFACPHETFVHSYLQQTGKHVDLIYEVEIVDSSAPTFTTYWNLTETPALPNGSQLPGLTWLNTVEAQAKQYWNWDKNPIYVPGVYGWLESIIASPIRIISRIDRRNEPLSNDELNAAFHEVLAAQ
jgi:hypothetical protein